MKETSRSLRESCRNKKGKWNTEMTCSLKNVANFLQVTSFLNSNIRKTNILNYPHILRKDKKMKIDGYIYIYTYTYRERDLDYETLNVFEKRARPIHATIHCGKRL